VRGEEEERTHRPARALLGSRLCEVAAALVEGLEDGVEDDRVGVRRVERQGDEEVLRPARDDVGDRAEPEVVAEHRVEQVVVPATAEEAVRARQLIDEPLVGGESAAHGREVDRGGGTARTGAVDGARPGECIVDGGGVDRAQDGDELVVGDEAAGRKAGERGSDETSSSSSSLQQTALVGDWGTHLLLA